MRFRQMLHLSFDANEKLWLVISVKPNFMQNFPSSNMADLAYLINVQPNRTAVNTPLPHICSPSSVLVWHFTQAESKKIRYLRNVRFLDLCLLTSAGSRYIVREDLQMPNEQAKSCYWENCTSLCLEGQLLKWFPKKNQYRQKPQDMAAVFFSSTPTLVIRSQTTQQQRQDRKPVLRTRLFLSHVPLKSTPVDFYGAIDGQSMTTDRR